MQPSSAAFDSAIYGGAQFASRVCVFYGDRLMEDTYYGGDQLRLISRESSVGYSRQDDTRTSASLKLQVVTTSALDLIDPVFFPEVRVYSGLKLGSDVEWIDMGILGIHTTGLSRNGQTVYANIEAADRSARIRDNNWPKPFQVAAGTDYYAAMVAVVNDRAKGFTPSYNVSSGSLTTPDMTFSEQDDPWGAVVKMAQAAGAEAYFDRQGVMAAFPIPDPLLQAPSLVLRPDTAGVLIMPTERSITNRDVFNGVICRAEAPWLLFPVSGEWWNTDPISPTYRYGPFGEKPKVIGDSLATTAQQCQDAAKAEYLKIAGVPEDITFTSMKDPRIEVGDIIDTIDDTLLISGRYVLDTLNYPLGPGPAQGTVRRRR